MRKGRHLSMRSLFLGLIHLYQRYVSPHLPQSCLYFPSCSHYTEKMIHRHGIIKGVLGGTLRILRCQGWLFQGGDDPVPRSFSWKRIFSRYLFFWRWRQKDYPKQRKEKKPC